jgi:DNA-directed RNA polymerase specialized sigma24 family protein
MYNPPYSFPLTFEVRLFMASVTLLIGQFKQGRSSAFGILFGRFLNYPVDLARRHLKWRSRIPQDDDDIAQLVFWELYRSVRRHGRLGQRLCDTPSLLTTLATLTRQQIRREWRDHTRQCRDVRLSRLATDLSAKEDADPLDDALDPAAFRWLREIESQETMEQLLALLPSARYRTLVFLLIRGHSIPEIARELDRSVRAVQRYLVEIQTIWRSHPAGQEILSQCLPLPAVSEPSRDDQQTCR